MPRNNQGQYVLPSGNPVVSGTLIESTWANTTMVDIGAELENSLDRNGRGGMLAPFKITDGAITAPGLAFTQETTSGLYRSASGVLNLSVKGSQVQQLEATRVQTIIAGTSTLDVQGTNITVNNAATTWRNSNAPAGDQNGAVEALNDGTLLFGKKTDDRASWNGGIRIGPDNIAYDIKTNLPFAVNPAAGVGYLPLSGGTLTGTLTVHKSDPLIVLYYPTGTVNLRNARIQLSSDGTLYWGRLNDAGGFTGGLVLYASTNQCYDIGTGQRILNLGDAPNLTVSNSDMVDGYHANIGNAANQIVVRAGDNVVYASCYDAGGCRWYNEGGWWRTAQPIYTSSAVKCNDISMNGMGVVNSAGWWHFYNGIESTSHVRAGDQVISWNGHIGGPIRDQGHCTLFMGGNRGCMAWENNELIFNVDNALYKRFQTYNYSDSRLKDNIKPTGVDALEILNGLDVIQYTIKPALAELLGEVEEHRIGLNADQISKVIPEAVSIMSEVGLEPSSIRPENLKMLGYAELVPWIIKAIQQLAQKTNA